MTVTRPFADAPASASEPGAEDFWAVDFETANCFRGSPCAVGMAHVVDGAVAETERMLMRPNDWMSGADLRAYFDPCNVDIHGITWRDVRDEPTFEQRLAEMQRLIGDEPVVAHNASFDTGVVRDACDSEGLDWPAWDYACTLTVGRTVYEGLPSYTLPLVCEAAGVRLDNHHDPVADAVAAAELALAYMRTTGSEGLGELLQRQRFSWGYLRPGGRQDGDTWHGGEWSGCVKKARYRPRGSGPRRPGGQIDRYQPDDQLEVENAADNVSELAGKKIVLTGAVPGLDRATVHDMIRRAGGAHATSVSKKTDLLVCGSVPASVRVDGNMTTKQKKALACGVEMMPALDFKAVLLDAVANIPPPESGPDNPR